MRPRRMHKLAFQPKRRQARLIIAIGVTDFERRPVCRVELESCAYPRESSLSSTPSSPWHQPLMRRSAFHLRALSGLRIRDHMQHGACSCQGMPGHEGEKCWFASSSEGKGTHVGASKDAAHEISAKAVPVPRPRSQDTLADT